MVTQIDRQTWPRRAHYEFFYPMSHPFYTLTFPADVTPLKAWTKERGLSFYYAMVYAVTQAMNRVEAFRFKDRDGEIILHDRLVPSFTDLTPGSELFRIVTVEADGDMEDFCRKARQVSRTQQEFMTKGPWDGDALIYFTCLPWFPITGLTNERDVQPGDSVPRVAWGRYEEKEGRYVLSLSLELNHRLLDGVHVGLFYEALTRFIEELQ